MRALVLHGPGAYRVEEDWPVPQVKPGWALVRVSYAGICGSDLPRFASTGSYHHPMVLGHEFSGVVAQPAPGSTRFNGGEQVIVLPLIPCGDCPGCRQNEPFHCTRYQFLGSRNDGGFAEYCLTPETNLLPLPSGIDPRCGAFIEPLAVALHVVRRSGFAAGQSALVFGAGAIGLLVASWLRVFAAQRVVIAELRPESIRIAHAAGFDTVVNPAAGELEGLPPFDHTFEAAGAGAALLAAITSTRDRGTLTVVGRDTRDTVIPLKTFERLMRREIDLRGCWGYNLTHDEAFLLEMLRQDRFPLAHLITQQIALADAPAMIAAMAERQLHFCKVLIDMERT